MDVNDVANILGLTNISVYKHIEHGNLHPVKKGRDWDFDGNEVYRFMHKRAVSKERHSPSNAPPDSVADKRQYSYRHIEGLIALLRRFECRYESQRRYMIMFEFEKMLTSVFIRYTDSNELISGREINEVLDYIESRRETDVIEQREIWHMFFEAISQAFIEPNDRFDRRPLFEDLIIDVAIELTSRP